ncbi:hypothetical protein JCGZ_25769 [Jatropha curcas]|uniref:Uncharacterized protein n=1 Tax=Jatropha curcas TaxID=180498 RepID=A0A067JJN5_JATCU|nr:hypothetical protein JCGZ_25769 [Jatropha curcas]
METEQEVILEPVSPTGQYLSNSVLSLCIISVVESQVPIDDSQAMSLLKDVFLPINPRFSSVMVMNKDGEKRWKKVEVQLKDHIKVPIFPTGMSTKFYSDCLDDYLSNLAMETLPQDQPLWEIHILKYPTSTEVAGNVIFKLHHSLGDGFSLMGALLSCLQRADDPSIPLTFPSVQLHTNIESKKKSICKSWLRIFSSISNTISDFCSSVVISSFLKDDISPIRSGHPGVEFLPVSAVTMSFSLDQIKQIRTKLGVTINDVISGTIFLGTRMYMEAMSKGSGKARTPALVLLNTRMFGGYKSGQEMTKPNEELPWGNHFAFLSVTIPKLSGSEPKDPLQFAWKARKTIQRKRASFAVYLTAKYLELVNKFRGPEAVSKYLRNTLKNSSTGLTNLIGPMEQMALANHPIKGFYFVVTNAPQSLMAGIVSYMGKLRVAALVEKDFIDQQKYKSCIENAFEMIFKAACEAPAPQN